MSEFDGRPVLVVKLPMALTNNNAGRGNSFWQSAKVRKDTETLLRSLGLVRLPFDHKVAVKVTRIMGKRQRLWDSSSVLRGNWKEIEDSAVACGWFHDDSPKFITHTAGYQDPIKQALPAIKIEIFEISA